MNTFIFCITCLTVQTSGHLYLQLVQSLCDIVTRHFTPAHTIVVSQGTPPHQNTIQTAQEDGVSNSLTIEDLGQMILKELNTLEEWPLLSFGPNDDFKEITPSHSKHEGYILLCGYRRHEDVVTDIGYQVKKLRNNWEWNPRAKFVILLMGTRDVDGKLLATDIFDVLWITRIVDTVVLILSSEEHTATDTGNALDAYIWFPYHPTGQCPDVKDAVLRDRWVLDKKGIGRFLHNASLFPLKVSRDLHGCSLTVSTFELPPMVTRQSTTKADAKNIIYDKGLEVQILAELAKSTNSFVKYRDAPPDGGQWGWNLGNGTWNGVTGEIARSYSDIAMDCLWYRCHLVKEIECLRPYLIDGVKWYVPCAMPYPRWMSLTRVFKLSMWLGFLAAYVVVSIIMWQVVKINSGISTVAAQNQAYSNLPKCLLNFWAIILEESASNNPPDVAVIRVVFFGWVLYCWAINTVYQTYFTSFLIDPGLQRQLASEDEILASGIEYNTETSITFLYGGLSGTRYPQMKVTKDADSAGERVAKGTLAFLFSKFLVDYSIAAKYMDADGKPRICETEDDFAFNFITMFVPKGSPLKARYDQVLLSLMQAGLVNLWWEDIKHATTLKQAADFNLPPGEYIALTMEHLQSAFYFLFLGYAISTISFLFEFFCYHSKWRRSK